jgi:segregation and condensation protein B
VETSLSEAALETLAIIALKQPVTRIEIEKIRGVGAGGVLENLLKRNLINVTGRRESLGRPLLYGVTAAFMQHFGLKDLKELQEELENINP